MRLLITFGLPLLLLTPPTVIFAESNIEEEVVYIEDYEDENTDNFEEIEKSELE